MTSSLGLKADEVPTFFDRLRGLVGMTPRTWLGLIAFLGGLWMLVRVPLKASRER
jgi:hypothetical protein